MKLYTLVKKGISIWSDRKKNLMNLSDFDKKHDFVLVE